MALPEHKKAAKYLQAKIKIVPQVGIICGSGLSGLYKHMTNTQVINYSDIPGFPQVHVAGHVGEIVFGDLAGVPTMCMRGRFHFYEGHGMQKVVLGVKVMRCLGCKVAIVTNAAGGLNRSFNIGDVMCVTDHFALPLMSGQHPLIGPHDAELGARFTPISNAYTAEMQEIVAAAASNLKMDFFRPKGCYALVSGPTYEAPSECKFLLNMGCDAVGMSTIPEIVVAHHCGLKVIGLSLITNKVIMPGEESGATHANHKEVLETADRRAGDVQGLVREVCALLKDKLPGMPDLEKIPLEAAKAKKKAAKKPAKKPAKKTTKKVVKKKKA